MRYIVLVLLNIPIILLALLNIVTKYKMKRTSKSRFLKQLALWVFILVVLVGSFPVYNIITGRPVIDSIDLSVFDIFQTTAIVFLFYVVNPKSTRYLNSSFIAFPALLKTQYLFNVKLTTNPAKKLSDCDTSSSSSPR